MVCLLAWWCLIGGWRGGLMRGLTRHVAHQCCFFFPLLFFFFLFLISPDPKCQKMICASDVPSVLIAVYDVQLNGSWHVTSRELQPRWKIENKSICLVFFFFLMNKLCYHSIPSQKKKCIKNSPLLIVRLYWRDGGAHCKQPTGSGYKCSGSAVAADFPVFVCWQRNLPKSPSPMLLFISFFKMTANNTEAPLHMLLSLFVFFFFCV